MTHHAPALARRVGVAAACLLAAACSGTAPSTPPLDDNATNGASDDAATSGGSSNAGGDDAGAASTNDDAAGGGSGGGTTGGSLPSLTFCKVSDPTNVPSAFTAQTGADSVAYSCKEACTDWQSCTFGVVSQGAPLMSARGGLQIQGLAFVVDGMGGHFDFTSDGDDVVVTHAGSGGTSNFNPFDLRIQATSTIKTVSLGWERGTTTVPGSFGTSGAGWFTRKDGNATSVRALVARPAAAIKWVKDTFAAGKKFGTVGSSMGTVATLGARVWYGLDSIFDYQMLIGGPGMWDVNAGCGRVHIAQGHCDVDVAPCTGNAMSSYGDDDPACPGGDAKNECRVPTVMAPLSGGGSAYDNIINYVGKTTACAPTPTDSRDATLDVSSMATTVASWSLHGRVDFVANEGGTQPPDADQGMGEGHAMEMYARITGPKSWIDNEGAHHGDSWDKVPALMAASAQHVVTGMGH